MGEFSRRAALAAAVGAGVLGRSPTPDAAATTTRGRQPADGDWRMFQYDAANSGNVTGTGPTEVPEVEWRFQFDGFAAVTPAVVDGTVYVGSRGGRLYALDVDSGVTEWQYAPGAPIEESPAVVDGTVYASDWTSVVHAVDADTGESKWTHAFDEDYHSPDSFTTVADGTVYVGSKDERIYALETETGAEQWAFQTGGLVNSTPAVDGDLVVAGSNDGRVYALDATTGEQHWSAPTGDEVRAGPAVAGDAVYVGSYDGHVRAFDAANGDERWSFDAGGPVRSSPTVGDETVYVGGSEGTIYALDAGTGRPRWTTTVGPDAVSSPTLADQVLYLGATATDAGGYNIALALARDTGERLWSLDEPADASGWTGPALVDGSLYVTGHDDSLYALRSPKPAGTDTSSPDVGGGSGDTDAPDEPPERGTQNEQPLQNWLDGWYPLFAWLVAVPLLGPLVLGALVALSDRAVDRDSDE